MNQFNFKDLIQMEKADLEKTKLALEIYQSEDKYNFERNKFRTENIRYIIIALMTSFISLGSAYIIEHFKQKNSTKTDLKKEFAELKKQYLIEKDKTKQTELACALAEFDNSLEDNSIKIAKSQYIKVCKSAEIIRKESDNIIQNTKNPEKLIKAANQVDGLEKIKQNLKTKAISAPIGYKVNYNIEINKISNSIDSIINKYPSLQTASKSSKSIELQTKKIETFNQALSNTPSLFSKSEIVWFKTGYFLHFGEYRILLQYLDKNLGIQVEVCRTSGSEICVAPLLTKAWVKYNTPLQFSDNGKTFKINLESIDYAGNNPFKQAAYITFESSK